MTKFKTNEEYILNELYKTQEELKYLKLQYEVAFKYDELLKMRKEINNFKIKKYVYIC